MGPVVDQMDFALSSPHIHTQHSAVVSVSWLSHLHTSYQVIACQTHQPEPKTSSTYDLEWANNDVNLMDNPVNAQSSHSIQ